MIVVGDQDESGGPEDDGAEQQFQFDGIAECEGAVITLSVPPMPAVTNLLPGARMQRPTSLTPMRKYLQ